MVELVTPYPPSVNHYWKQAGKRRFLSHAAKHFREAVCAAWVDAGNQKLGGVPVRVEIEVTPPDRRRRDLDNTLKAILDSMQGLVYQDDSQVVELVVRRLPAAKPGRVVVRVAEAKDV